MSQVRKSGLKPNRIGPFEAASRGRVELIEIFELCKALELAAVEKVAENITENDIFCQWAQERADESPDIGIFDSQGTPVWHRPHP